FSRDWSSDVCSSDLGGGSLGGGSLGGGSLGGGSLGGGSLGGGSLGGSLGATTRIVKGGSVVVAWPSLTEMTMLRYLPVCAADGKIGRASGRGRGEGD